MHTLSRFASGLLLTPIFCLCSTAATTSPGNTQDLEFRKNCSSLSAPGHYPDYKPVPRYSIEDRKYAPSDPATLVLRVSVPTKALNSGSMTRLACQLASEFKAENHIDALIFDDRKAARSLAPGFTDQRDYGIYLWHLKGHYLLDRQNGQQYIEFVIPDLKDRLLTLRRVRVWIETPKSQ